jgi:hypothetical protein
VWQGDDRRGKLYRERTQKWMRKKVLLLGRMSERSKERNCFVPISAH